jgi:hypothetical protein
MPFARGNMRDHIVSHKNDHEASHALRSIAVVEPAKNQLLREFRRRSIFDFCNTICQQRTYADVAALLNDATNCGAASCVDYFTHGTEPEVNTIIEGEGRYSLLSSFSSQLAAIDLRPVRLSPSQSHSKVARSS